MSLVSGNRIALATLAATVFTTALPAYGQTYVKATAGSGQTKAADYSFINPLGVGFTLNATSGDRILLDKADGRLTRWTPPLTTDLKLLG